MILLITKTSVTSVVVDGLGPHILYFFLWWLISTGRNHGNKMKHETTIQYRISGKNTIALSQVRSQARSNSEACQWGMSVRHYSWGMSVRCQINNSPSLFIEASQRPHTDCVIQFVPYFIMLYLEGNNTIIQIEVSKTSCFSWINPCSV